MSDYARKIGKAAIAALYDRRGFDDLIDSIDAETMREIYDSVGLAAVKAMRKLTHEALK